MPTFVCENDPSLSLSLSQDFLQEVESYQPSMDDVSHSEEALFSTDLATIQACEPAVVRRTSVHRRSSTPRPLSVISPVPSHSLVSHYTQLCTVHYSPSLMCDTFLLSILKV